MDISTARQNIDRVIAAFLAACQDVGCCERRTSVGASSGFDPTVRFIGSHISVLLPFMLERRLPPDGIAMWQDCIRTRSLQTMLRTGRLESPWGSYFVGLGAVLPPTHQEQASVLLRGCLEDRLGLKPSHIEVSFHPTDRQVAGIATQHLSSWRLREDTELRSYRHKVGVENVKGKNLNVGISSNGVKFDGIANIILYEDVGVPCGVEVALGTSTVVKVLLNLNHVVDTFPFPSFDGAAPAEVVRCWKDVAATSLQLMREGLSITGQHNRHRLLRKYLSVFRGSEVTAQLGAKAVREILETYLSVYYTSDFVLDWPPGVSSSTLIDQLMG